jgi:hypothetical protein
MACKSMAAPKIQPTLEPPKITQIQTSSGRQTPPIQQTPETHRSQEPDQQGELQSLSPYDTGNSRAAKFRSVR